MQLPLRKKSKQPKKSKKITFTAASNMYEISYSRPFKQISH